MCSSVTESMPQIYNTLGSIPGTQTNKQSTPPTHTKKNDPQKSNYWQGCGEIKIFVHRDMKWCGDCGEQNAGFSETLQ